MKFDCKRWNEFRRWGVGHAGGIKPPHGKVHEAQPTLHLGFFIREMALTSNTIIDRKKHGCFLNLANSL